MLIVQECLPFVTFPSHSAIPTRVAHVDNPGDALTLPWIKGLPGEKRICFFRGQVFVIQRYLGFKLVRAHIYHAQQPTLEAALGEPATSVLPPHASDEAGRHALAS